MERNMTIPKLSEDGALHWAWRFNMKAELIQYTPFETEPGRLFVEELETGNFDELGQELPPVLTAIDAKLYGALLTATQHLPTLVMKISTNVRQGCGRQVVKVIDSDCLLYTSPSPRDKRQSRMPSSA